MRTLTGITPSGALHIGNYFGAMRPAIEAQAKGDCYYFIADYHSMTSVTDPAERRALTRGIAIDWLACGLDPAKSVFWRQSDVPEVCELTWMIGSLTPMGLLERAHSYKDKTSKGLSPNFGLFAYPVLMAADILLYAAEAVPVGDDQRQHLELARTLALRFNNRYGETFTVPEAAIPGAAARVMDLQHPERKMSKSVESPLGTIGLLDPAEEITRKIRKAVTDTDGEVRYDRVAKPGLANLLDLLAAATDGTPQEVAKGYTRYGDLKKDVAEALSELLRPVRERRAELERDPSYVGSVLAEGAAQAHGVAELTYARAADAVGLLPPFRA